MIIGRWLVIETLGQADTWSVLVAGSAPREWKSYHRAVPARLQPIVTAAYSCGTAVDYELPPSRHVWSGRQVQAAPLLGPGDRVHAVRLWVGSGDPPVPVGITPFTVDGRTRRVEAVQDESGSHFDRTRTVWIGAEAFEMIERFDSALELVTTMARSEPGGRWLDTATVRSTIGPRTLLLAARNPDPDRHHWVGVAVDVTDSVAPQPKSFEAATLELLRGRQSNLYLLVVDLAQVRLVRWVTEPVPGLRWGGVTDERTMPHPHDRPRILTARADVRAGSRRVRLDGVRLAATTGDWIVADVEASPLPCGTPDFPPAAFALVQLAVVGHPAAE
ncbi:GAF domain-containing protein [Nocardia sp. NPDC023852]|uniref:GAF domain-containing protein n=1 Tax=Nocardia sp. NPDC023852 TaxID=3154697 RepID=UPI0033FE0889